MKRIGQRKKTKKHLVIFMSLIPFTVNLERISSKPSTHVPIPKKTYETVHDGISKIFMSRLQLPGIKFGNLKIKNDENHS